MPRVIHVEAAGKRNIVNAVCAGEKADEDLLEAICLSLRATK